MINGDKTMFGKASLDSIPFSNLAWRNIAENGFLEYDDSSNSGFIKGGAGLWSIRNDDNAKENRDKDAEVHQLECDANKNNEQEIDREENIEKEFDPENETKIGIEKECRGYTEEESDQLSATQSDEPGVLFNSVASPACTVDMKHRCSYLSEILAVYAKSSDFSAPVISQVNKKWDGLVLKSFSLFRTYLDFISAQFPSLKGECPDREPPIERRWKSENWRNEVLERDVSLNVLGAMDSVRASSVLKAISQSLRQLNEDQFGLKGNPNSGRIIKRLSEWCFAALASLDELQAIEETVAYNLQVIRRNLVRAKKNLMEKMKRETGGLASSTTWPVQNEANISNMHSELITRLEINELIITQFFNQK